MIPDFDRRGYLPPGIHQTTLEEFCARFGGNPVRERLLNNLRSLVSVAATTGARKFIIVGSFVTAKEEPGDIDAILILPANFDTNSWQAQLFRRAYIRYNIHLFPVPESNERLLDRWIDFFQTDQDNIPRGLVEVEL
ncbi:MAG: hypothetical protein ACE5PV_15635 [Candidatus Poribacteria bacterium]